MFLPFKSFDWSTRNNNIMSKRQSEMKCDILTLTTGSSNSTQLLDRMVSPKKRGSFCGRSSLFKDCLNVSRTNEFKIGQSRMKRPSTICLSQSSNCKVSKSPQMDSPSNKLTPFTTTTTTTTVTEGPSRINEFIFLGSQSDASSESVLKTFGITHVLNITSNLPKSPFISEGNFLRVSVNDNQSDQLLPHFNQVFKFIDGIAVAGGSVLVHCMAGISRSATMVIAYLMHSSHLSFNDAYRIVKQKRPNIAPNFNFLGQLMEFEAYLHIQKKSQECVDLSASFTGALTPSAIESFHSNMSRTQDVLLSYSDSDLKFDGTSPFLEAKISPIEELLKDVKYHCRTNSLNKSNSSLSSIGSHESIEILQVS